MSRNGGARRSSSDWPGIGRVFPQRQPNGLRQGVLVRVAALWRFSEKAAQWLRVEYALGASEVESVYQQVLAGRSDPQTGHVMSLLEAG